MDESQTGKDKVMISALVSPESKERIIKYADQIGVSVSDIVRMAVNEYLYRHNPSMQIVPASPNHIERTLEDDRTEYS